MKFIRWMLSNLILITIVLALVYVYVYWDDLTGEDTPAGKIIASLSDEFTEVRDFVAIIKAKGSVDGPASSEAESVVSSDDSEVVAAQQPGNDGQPAAVVAQHNDSAYSAPAPAQPGGNYYNAPAPAQRAENYYNAPAPAQRAENYYNAPAPAPAQAQRAENYYNAPAPAPAPVQRGGNYYNSPAPAPVQRAENYYNAPAPAPAPVQRGGNYYNAPAAAPAQPPSDISEAVEPSASDDEQLAAKLADADTAESEDRFVPPEIEQALNRVSVDGKISGGTVEAVKPSATLAQAPPSDLGSITPEPEAVAAPEQVAEAKQAATAVQAQAAAPEQATVPGQAPLPVPQSAASQTAGSAAGVTGIDAATRALWLDARRAFRKRDYETCEQNYEKLIAANKDNMDAYGELGNVYFNQGKREQAAAAYYEAAAIMIKQGQVRRAASLSGLLRHLDQTKADQLKSLIDNTMQSSS